MPPISQVLKITNRDGRFVHNLTVIMVTESAKGGRCPMKRTVWMMAAVGIVLLGLAACGSAAPESPDENTLFAANGPALTDRKSVV